MTDGPTNPFEPPFDPNYNPYYPPLPGTSQSALPTTADPYLSGASRFLPQEQFDAFQDPQRSFVPNYSHFYNPQNFLEQTPQPTFAPPFYHSGPPSANPAPPLLPGNSQFPYPIEEPVAEIPTEVSPIQQAGQWVQSQTGKAFWLGPEGRRWEGPEMTTAMPGWQVDPRTGEGVNSQGGPINVIGGQVEQAGEGRRWVEGMGGNRFWLGPQGRKWEGPEMQTATPGFQIDPRTGEGVNAGGQGISIRDGQVVPNQPSQANNWAMGMGNNPFFIGPLGYKWESPQMLNQLGVNDTGTWRIDPETGYGVNANGQRILVKNGQVQSVGW